MWRDRGKYAKIGFQLTELLFMTENCPCCWSDSGRNSVPDKKSKPELSSALGGLNRNSVPTKPELSSYNHNSLHNSKRGRGERDAPSSRPSSFFESDFLKARKIYLAAAGVESSLPEGQLTRQDKADCKRVWAACSGNAETVEKLAKTYLAGKENPSFFFFAKDIEDVLVKASRGNQPKEDDVNWIN